MSTRSVQQILASVLPATPVATPRNGGTNKRRLTPKVFHRECACKAKFITTNPKHDKCGRCARALFRARTEQEAALKQRDELRTCLRDAFVSKELPPSARVIQKGTQVVVVWQGRSHTFHVSA